MQDIAVLTRGQVISEDVGMKLANVTLNELGRAKRVTITKEATTIVEGAGPLVDIEGRSNTSGRKSRRPRQSTTARTSTSAWRNWSVASR